MIQFDKSFHPIATYKLISFAYSIKLKIEVKSWNNDPPPPHTHLGRGGGLLDLPWIQRQLRIQICSVGPLNGKKILSPKIKQFGLHKIAWGPWQPIGHCSWVRSMSPSFESRPETDTCVPQIFRGFFPYSANSRKAKCQLMAKQNGC